MNEKRKYERYPVVLGSDIDFDEPRIRFGLTQDVSKNGARLLTISEYDAGTEILLKIFLSEQQETECKARVIRCSPVEDRGMWHFEVGVELEELLEDDVVTALQDASSQA